MAGQGAGKESSDQQKKTREDGGRAQATHEPLRDDQIQEILSIEMMGDFKETAGRTRKDTSESQKQGMTASSDSQPSQRVGRALHESSLNSWKFSPSGRTRRGARGCSPGARLPRSARALKAGRLPRAGGAGSRDLLTSPALLQDLARPTPSQHSTCSPHPTQKHGRSALSWSLPLMPRRDEPGHPLLVSPSGPEVGPPLALMLKGVRHAHRRLSSLSTSTSTQTPAFHVPQGRLA